MRIDAAISSASWTSVRPIVRPSESSEVAPAAAADADRHADDDPGRRATPTNAPSTAANGAQAGTPTSGSVALGRRLGDGRARPAARAARAAAPGAGRRAAGSSSRLSEGIRRGRGSSASDAITGTPGGAGARAVASHEHRPQPCRERAGDVGLGRVAGVQRGVRAARRPAPARGRRWRASGLAAPTSAEATAPSTQRRQPGLLEPLVQRVRPSWRPPRAACPSARSARSARRHVRVGVEAQGGEQRVREHARSGAADRAAPGAWPRRRGAAGRRAIRPVAALVQVRAVVGDLGADGRLAPPPADTSIPRRSRSAARRCGAGGSKCTSVPSASRSTAWIACATRHECTASSQLASTAGLDRRGACRHRARAGRGARRRGANRCGAAAASSPARPTRGCASCAGSSTRRSS